MKYTTRFLLFFAILFVSFNVSGSKLRIIIVTGGHDFDREPFFQMFDSFTNLTWIEYVHPEALAKLGNVDLATFDAVVFYDMPKTITEIEKASYYRLLQAGKGLVFLHHSICAYQDWPEYESIVGGKYYEKKKNERFGASSYQHDVDFYVQIVHPTHPVVKGIDEFVLSDEVYGNLEVIPEIYPLLSTDHPKSNILIGWTLTKDKSKIVYIQPGHDKKSWENENYRRLVKQAIQFVAKK
ncbi:MAG: ThuA domain-containing protein [Mariniphaga sp.]